MTLTCPLCGGTSFRAIDEGQHCRGCGAILDPAKPDTRRWSPFNTFAGSTEREAIGREDADHLLDLVAAERSTGVRDRSMGR